MEDFYREEILDHYHSPRHRGRLPDADSSFEDDNPLCGDRVRMEVRFANDGTIAEARFDGEGCAISQAAASMLCESVQGRSVEEVGQWDKKQVLELLGITLTPLRLKCGLLPLKVLQAALWKFAERGVARRGLLPLVLQICLVTICFLLTSGCSRKKPAAQPQPTEAAPPSVTVTPAVPAPAVEQPVAPAARPESIVLATGRLLYANYCTSCHGESGDGNGPAARFLYPRPRNFRDARFRVVTTVNRNPSDEDLLHVISRGMPGSAMFPFGHLSEPDLRALAAYVRHLTRAGIEERLRGMAEEGGEPVDSAELAADVDMITKPGARIDLPPQWPTGTESVARGRAMYVKQQCSSCHGDSGKGDGVQVMRDDDGTPNSPRDYTRGIFKGGREREQLYARTLLGMPGSPMPASANLTPQEICDIVNYIQSLAPPSAQVQVEHRRSHLLAARAEEIPESTPDAAWDAARPVHIVLSPLWWRNYEDPELEVRALHDGRTVAIRMIWRDHTHNDRAIRPQDFSDLAAVQLFQGEREPFLGMGAADSEVELWLWQADWEADLRGFGDVETAYPARAVDLYPFEKLGEGSTAHPLENQPREFITALAAGNPRSDPQRGSAASSHQAQGFGTLTPLPSVSQFVTARGQWSEGRWSVVLRRPVRTSDGTGVPLIPGQRYSIAFAVWDGAASDRNGQKLVSIWHDLEVE